MIFFFVGVDSCDDVRSVVLDDIFKGYLSVDVTKMIAMFDAMRFDFGFEPGRNFIIPLSLFYLH